MIRVETNPSRGETTLHVDDEGAEVLRLAVDDVNRRGASKVFIGDAGAMLILRHTDYDAASGEPAA